MKTYKINDKEYTEFDINKRCAEIMYGSEYVGFTDNLYDGHCVAYLDCGLGLRAKYNPLTNPSDTWPIIERVWDELTNVACLSTGNLEWHQLTEKHKCTKLVAACICFIEINS